MYVCMGVCMGVCMCVCIHLQRLKAFSLCMRSIVHCVAWPAAEYDECDVMAEPQEEGRGE